MKKIILIFLGMIIVCISYIYLICSPIIIQKSNEVINFIDSCAFYNPIETIDFTQGENKIIIYTNAEEVSFLPQGMKKWILLECKDNVIIETIKSNFLFERVSSDFVESTDLDSRIFILHNNKLVFSSKIQIDNDVELYFQNTGWTYATNSDNLIKAFSIFEPIYWPVIKIN